MVKNFILASQSPQRKMLLSQIGFEPAKIEPADIDETPKNNEKPSQYVKRMAKEKALFVANKHKGEVVLASDTVVVCGTTIIQKSQSDEEQIRVMQMLSGKTHRVLTGVCVVDKEGKAVVRLNTTKIEGLLAGFVKQIIGSYSGVVGLPLFETRNLLIGAGIK